MEEKCVCACGIQTKLHCTRIFFLLFKQTLFFFLITVIISQAAQWIQTHTHTYIHTFIQLHAYWPENRKDSGHFPNGTDLISDHLLTGRCSSTIFKTQQKFSIKHSHPIGPLTPPNQLRRGNQKCGDPENQTSWEITVYFENYDN